MNISYKREILLKVLTKDTEQNLHSLKFDITKVPEIELIEIELFNALADSKGVIREMCSHILNAGGKRIRPLLVLYSGLIFSRLSKELIDAAVAAELIHMASLVHDDIIDKSFLRRNKPSVNKVWGNHFAVLCGDYLFAKSFGILSSNKLINSMGYMVEAIQNMCQGEIVQAGDKFNLDVTLEEYYARIAMKTAVLLSNCCKSGACIRGADKAQIETIGEYGLELGYAFQIVDDILDFRGDIRVMGKPKSEDLRQGIITLPIILLMSKASFGKRLKELLAEGKYTENKMQDIFALLNESGAINEAFDIAASHISRAQEALGKLPQSQHTEFLYGMAQLLQARMN
jgi:heptaprenyl diphosphate synthase